MVLTCAAGYTGPGLFGLGSAALLAAGHAIGLLWALLLLLALLLVQIRNWYGLWSVLITGSVVFAATWWL
ncbi:M50 family metallopeptidase, partial [Klebsiella pneumoniae]|nr:M50 family metallopeptidase [Klebsiella pneumoniae]